MVAYRVHVINMIFLFQRQQYSHPHIYLGQQTIAWKFPWG